MGRPKTDTMALALKVQAMTISDQLRLAAGLVEQDRADLAEAIAKTATDRLKLARLFPAK